MRFLQPSGITTPAAARFSDNNQIIKHAPAGHQFSSVIATKAPGAPPSLVNWLATVLLGVFGSQWFRLLIVVFL